jgi:transposase InsO family protein
LAAVHHSGSSFLQRGGEREALVRYICPEIFNTDQGSQFTSHDFTSVLFKNKVALGMDDEDLA